LELSANIGTANGNPDPLGASVQPEGTNFSIFSRSALGLDLLLFDSADDPQPARTITLDATVNRTHHYWHVFLPGVGHGQVYAWRVRGPHQPDRGHLFDGDKVLLDPYGRAVAGTTQYDRQAAKARGDNCARALRSVVIDSSVYDWEGDQPLARPSGREVIYEMHTAGFTKSPSSGLPDNLRGTYAGLREKISYLQELGVTAVELMPVHQFDPKDAPPGLTNFWGYSSISYFAPHRGFSSDRSTTGPVDEFRDLVKALHRAGIRVILDVVYNHTSEGGVDGPVLSWRGLENSAYYIFDQEKKGYADFTGCGNTFSANDPVGRRLVLDSLRYWVREMHVDGFRFDLASAMARDTNGHPMDRAPVLWAMDTDPILAGTTLIAEAWDAGGLYQVGNFSGERFAQWNGPFRDDVRGFLRGDEGKIESLMARIVGSPDLFSGPAYRPSHCINFVACHDGFSLADLVSYEKKHNLINGEENRDGSDHNLSSNHGVEGPSDDPKIERVRQRQIRNFLCLLFLSHGTPMLWMGDEARHTRKGNNNPWCQDNELNWLDWNLVQANADLLRFTRELILFSRSLPIFADDRFWSATSPGKKGDITWHGVQAGKPDWTPPSHSLAYTLVHPSQRDTIHVMLNAGPADLKFQVPANRTGHQWRRIIDTAADAPADFILPGEAKALPGSTVRVINRSISVLLESPIIA
jgi:isoamylase